VYPEQIGEGDMGKKKILIVEDDADTQILLKKRLERLGYDCLSAFSVESALESLKSIIPNLVILDLGFASANGTAFLQVAKDWLPEGCHEVPPVIVLSGHKEDEIVEYALDNGAKGFLSKPVDPQTLISMVNNYIR
jgi:DNA-binding response OmpR family regulator